RQGHRRVPGPEASDYGRVAFVRRALGARENSGVEMADDGGEQAVGKGQRRGVSRRIANGKKLSDGVAETRTHAHSWRCPVLTSLLRCSRSRRWFSARQRG